MAYRCRYCDTVYCVEHRLPESHECDGFEFLADSGKRFERKFSDEVNRDITTGPRKTATDQEEEKQPEAGESSQETTLETPETEKQDSQEYTKPSQKEDFKKPEPIDSDSIQTYSSAEADWSEGKSPPVQTKDEVDKSKTTKSERTGINIPKLLHKVVAWLGTGVFFVGLFLFLDGIRMVLFNTQLILGTSLFNVIGDPSTYLVVSSLVAAGGLVGWYKSSHIRRLL